MLRCEWPRASPYPQGQTCTKITQIHNDLVTNETKPQTGNRSWCISPVRSGKASPKVWTVIRSELGKPGHMKAAG
jgi:hypothetical protein